MNSLTVDSQSNVISLSGELSFSTVKKMLEESTTLFASISDLDIDLSKVDRSDSAGLALLVHWMRVAKQENKKIVFHNIPSQMLAIADASGLNELLPIQ